MQCQKQFTKNYSAESAVRLPATNALTHTSTVKAVYCRLLCKNNSPLTDPDDSRVRRFSSVRPATLKHAHLQTMWPEYTVLGSQPETALGTVAYCLSKTVRYQSLQAISG